ncbi:hypothetical protein Q1695_007517 [Nippostrongylus brasiliensis]|nr:hypothetical protein Q1695_007517 [Nippostrongylus brasiliensis]
MLFASGLRKAVEQADPSTAAIMLAAEETNRVLVERRRRQMIRRHTCSTLRPDLDDIRTVSFLTPPLEVVEDESESNEVKPLPPSVPPPVTTRPPVTDDWGTSAFALPTTAPVPPYNPGKPVLENATSVPTAASSAGGDEFDDEWTDEDEDLAAGEGEKIYGRADPFTTKREISPYVDVLYLCQSSSCPSTALF